MARSAKWDTTHINLFLADTNGDEDHWSGEFFILVNLVNWGSYWLDLISDNKMRCEGVGEPWDNWFDGEDRWHD